MDARYFVGYRFEQHPFYSFFLPQQRCIALLACAFIKLWPHSPPIGSLGSLSTNAIKFADAKHGPNRQDNKRQG